MSPANLAPPSPRPARPVVIAPTDVPEHRGIVGFMSNMTRDGDWVLPRVFRVAAAMSSVKLDLTRVRIGAGTSRIEIKALMANLTILVPPELRVECDLEPFMGSIEVKRRVEGTTSPQAPLVEITGTAVLTSVEIKVVDPNAPGVLDRLRARWSSQG